jgi:hypothetical protein
MISATLLALVSIAAPAQPASGASAYLKAPAAAAPACRTERVDGQLVRAPLFSADSQECPVANVAGDVIVLGELAQALEAGHLNMPRRRAAAAKPDMDFRPALDRLIASRLVVLEAREMGLDEAPDFTSAVSDYRASRLRAMLQREAARRAKPDPAEVERLYRETVREWKVKSILLEKEDAAKAFEAALKAGGSFDALSKRYIAEKKAKGDAKAEFVPPKHMLPEVREALEKAKPGTPTGLIKVPAGWVVMRIDGARYPPNDKAARAEARSRSLARVEQKMVRDFYLSLVKKHATVDEALLKKLDFEAGGVKGFEALLADKRTVVAIRGEAPITVGDLTREVSMKFFHGLEGPIQQKRVNRQKEEAFEKLLGSRLFAKEAAARKLDQRLDFRREMAEYERGLAFNTFIEKVIAPDVKVTEADALGYYEEHKAEFTAPQMYKLDGFAFATTKEAQAALDKLKGGTDFTWLRSSAPGQLPPEKRSLQFDGATLSATALPADLAKALTGVRSGEYRLYAPRAGEVYVIRVVEQIPPAPQPYVDAREKIAKSLFNRKLTDAMGEYAAKLRKAQPVDVLITRVSM